MSQQIMQRNMSLAPAHSDSQIQNPISNSIILDAFSNELQQRDVSSDEMRDIGEESLQMPQRHVSHRKRRAKRKLDAQRSQMQKRNVVQRPEAICTEQRSVSPTVSTFTTASTAQPKLPTPPLLQVKSEPNPSPLPNTTVARNWDWPFSFDSEFINPTTSSSAVSINHVNCPRCGHQYNTTGFTRNSVLDVEVPAFGVTAAELERDRLRKENNLLKQQIEEQFRMLRIMSGEVEPQTGAEKQARRAHDTMDDDRHRDYILSHSLFTERNLLERFNLDMRYELCHDYLNESALLFGGGQSMIYLLNRMEDDIKTENLSSTYPQPKHNRCVLKVYSSTVHPSLSLTEIDILSSIHGNSIYVPTLYDLEAHNELGIYQHAIVLEYIENIPFVHTFFSTELPTKEEDERVSREVPSMDAFTYNLLRQNAVGGLAHTEVKQECDFKMEQCSSQHSLADDAMQHVHFCHHCHTLFDVPHNAIFSLPLLKSYMHHLLSALRDIHREGVIHRDIKPPNVLFHPYTCAMRLIDFAGSVKGYKKESRHSAFVKRRDAYPDETVFARHSYYGTQGFMAPETVLGVGIMTSAVDVWAAGVIFLSVLSQKYPVFLPKNDSAFLAELICYLHAQEQLSELAALYGIELDIEGTPANYSAERSSADVIRMFCEHSREHMRMMLREREELGGLGLVECIAGEEEAALLHDAYDLAAKLLCINPEKRITAREALEHSFFDSVRESNVMVKEEQDQ